MTCLPTNRAGQPRQSHSLWLSTISFLQLSFSHIFEIVYCESEQFRNKATKLAVHVPMEFFFSSFHNPRALDALIILLFDQRGFLTRGTRNRSYVAFIADDRCFTRNFLRNGRMEPSDGSLRRWEIFPEAERLKAIIKSKPFHLNCFPFKSHRFTCN